MNSAVRPQLAPMLHFISKAYRPTHHVIISRAMTTHPIITQPKGQVILSLEILHPKIVRLASKIILIVMKPNQLPPRIEDGGPRLGQRMAARGREGEEAVIVLRTALDEVGLGRPRVLGGDIVALGCEAVGAAVEGIVEGRRRGEPRASSGAGVEACCEMPKEETGGSHEGDQSWSARDRCGLVTVIGRELLRGCRAASRRCGCRAEAMG